jgi:hypothetical protein
MFIPPPIIICLPPTGLLSSDKKRNIGQIFIAYLPFLGQSLDSEEAYARLLGFGGPGSKALQVSGAVIREKAFTKTGGAD